MADEIRMNVSKETLSHGQVLTILDISDNDYEDISTAIPKELTDQKRMESGLWVLKRLEEIHRRSTAVTAHMLESVSHKIRNFKENHVGYSDHQFISLLPKLLNDVQKDVSKLE